MFENFTKIKEAFKQKKNIHTKNINEFFLGQNMSKIVKRLSFIFRKEKMMDKLF